MISFKTALPFPIFSKYNHSLDSKQHIQRNVSNALFKENAIFNSSDQANVFHLKLNCSDTCPRYKAKVKAKVL